MYKAASFGLLRCTPLRSSSSSLFKPLTPSRVSASLVGSRSVRFVRPLGVLSGSLRYSCGSDRRSSLLSPRALIGDKPAAVLDRFERKIATMAAENPFKGILTSLPKQGGGEFGKYFSLPALNDPRIGGELIHHKMVDQVGLRWRVLSYCLILEKIDLC